VALLGFLGTFAAPFAFLVAFAAREVVWVWHACFRASWNNYTGACLNLKKSSKSKYSGLSCMTVYVCKFVASSIIFVVSRKKNCVKHAPLYACVKISHAFPKLHLGTHKYTYVYILGWKQNRTEQKFAN